MNAESSRLRSTGKTSSGIRAIWPGALVVVYLTVTAVLLLAGWSRVRPGGVAIHFTVLAAMAAATWLKPVPRWLNAWAPLLALLFLYSELPMLIRAAGHTGVNDAFVIQWESALFRSQPARTWAASVPSHFVSELLHLCYLAYYAIIFAVPAALVLSRRDRDFVEAVFALMLTFVVCFSMYVAFPVAGPRYLWPSLAPQGPIRDAVIGLLGARSSHGTAFPSSHVAVSVAQSVLAVRYFGARGAVIAIVTLGLAFGAIYGGFHYAIDVVAGALLGAGTAVAGLGAVKRMSLGERQRADIPAADSRS
jgi:membrane-associated phospholipid phosphatase